MSYSIILGSNLMLMSYPYFSTYTPQRSPLIGPLAEGDHDQGVECTPVDPLHTQVRLTSIIITVKIVLMVVIIVFKQFMQVRMKYVSNSHYGGFHLDSIIFLAQ